MLPYSSTADERIDYNYISAGNIVLTEQVPNDDATMNLNWHQKNNVVLLARYHFADFQINNDTMKKLIIFFLIAISISAQAQKITGCGFKVPPRSLLKSNFASVYEAKTILKNMLDSIKWKENFNVREENGIRNAYATIIRNARWIIYDNNFLEDIDAYAATKWASISVLAHEMGHHYYNHVVSNQGSTPPKEIEADDEIEAVNKYGEWYDDQNKYSLATKTIEISVAEDKFSDVRSKFIISDFNEAF